MAGGVSGMPVSSVVADEGSTSGSATTAIQSLLARDVDVIIGPGSSTIALSTLDEIVSSGTLACSPTASALALDGFPDGGLFFRTVPSDSLQARAIADVADQTGALQVAIVHIDDSYGRDFADSVEAAIADGSVSVVETITFTDRDVDLTDEARQLLDSGAQVAIVLADDDDGTRFLETLGEFDTSGAGNRRGERRHAQSDDTATDRRARHDLRYKIVGLAPQAESADPDAPFDPPGLFAANAFDCVNLIALAAVRADSDAPGDIADEISSVSSGGSVCRTFADCVAAIDAGLQVDYNGPSGLTEIARTGDPSRALFDRFVYDADGVDRFERTVTVGL